MSYLQGLNPAQLQSVEHPPHMPLQILAGPGSGKTKVLTSRIAHLIAHHKLSPASICAVTFTNKAAKEMRERLQKLIGKERTAEIKMGTFHALCAMFLRRYAELVGLEGNFTVCDADESKKIIGKLLKPYKDALTERNIMLKEGTVMSYISKAKAKGHSADAVLADLAKRPVPSMRSPGSISDFIDRTAAAVYKDYEKTLRDHNSLDFDDLLVFGVQLFGEHRKVVKWCRHVLVDEFQDTNIMQYDLMKHIAAASKCVTIVGDPDQSIYGWRSAEVANLGKMQRDFPNTQQILLERNYRSTASILAVSLAIVSQDKKRVPKSLHTTHASGPAPTLRELSDEKVEAAFIAAEIKRVVAYSGGMLGWGDFVVLLRFNALSRAIEAALQVEGIPCRVLAGHKFFERLEVKDLLAYLQLVDNPKFVPAFSRVINVPGRSIGEKTIAELLSRAENMKLAPLELAELIYDGKTPDIKPAVKRKLGPFIEPIRKLRKLANECSSPSNLIRRLLELTNYGDHLRKTQPDWESRWDNVQELINFASEVESGARIQASIVAEDSQTSDLGACDFTSQDTSSQPLPAGTPGESSEDTPLRLFLQASMLSTDTETENEKDVKEKVTLSTCHSAKGLEWPVVFVPSVEVDTFPASRAEDDDEERRLLYVACTRAQGLLYLTHVTTRKFAGNQKPKALSPFLTVIRQDSPNLFTHGLPDVSQEDRTLMATLLGRPLPDEGQVERMKEEYLSINKHPASLGAEDFGNQVYEHTIDPCQAGYGHENPWLRTTEVAAEYWDAKKREEYSGEKVVISSSGFPTLAGGILQMQPRYSPPQQAAVVGFTSSRSLPCALESLPHEPHAMRPALEMVTSPSLSQKSVRFSHPYQSKPPTWQSPSAALSSRPKRTAPTRYPQDRPLLIDRNGASLGAAAPSISDARSTRDNIEPPHGVASQSFFEDTVPHHPGSAASAKQDNLTSYLQSHTRESAKTVSTLTASLLVVRSTDEVSGLPRTAHPASSTSSTTGPTVTQKTDSQIDASVALGKRRLGMGRSTIGYQNKKFKVPGS